ncbi:hypothetical protein OG402_32490 [Streptomyces anulatus]|uniref:hypothetical protein n=1 Tax=Streptomyces anulatus TaxID=1892 RepID=UPI00225751EC|nr:hypothetical protein [Streptomyces anulatus]MCX4522307.1 hypothetical protein [Streptomyces anulatus]MCX4605183.1 hypothetical protein [Streptomyces anulatus]
MAVQAAVHRVVGDGLRVRLGRHRRQPYTVWWGTVCAYAWGGIGMGRPGRAGR